MVLNSTGVKAGDMQGTFGVVICMRPRAWLALCEESFVILQYRNSQRS